MACGRRLFLWRNSFACIRPLTHVASELLSDGLSRRRNPIICFIRTMSFESYKTISRLEQCEISVFSANHNCKKTRSDEPNPFSSLYSEADCTAVLWRNLQSVEWQLPPIRHMSSFHPGCGNAEIINAHSSKSDCFSCCFNRILFNGARQWQNYPPVESSNCFVTNSLLDIYNCSISCQFTMLIIPLELFCNESLFDGRNWQDAQWSIVDCY